MGLFTSLKNFFKLFKSNNKRKVLMTGFGPFHQFKTNPSWEALNSMDSKKIQNKYNIILKKEPISVRYTNVDISVPQLLDDFRPDLTIHVGVSGKASCFRLETRAERKGYEQPDVAGHQAAPIPKSSHRPDVIVTGLDVTAICNEFRSGQPGDDLQVEISNDAEGYLCEYIYYKSLSCNRCPTLFVHVPYNKYTSAQLAQGLDRILGLCLDQLADKNKKKQK